MELNEIKNKIFCGDCVEIMKQLPDNCIDTIITDPPYNLTSITKRFANANPKKEIYAMQKSKSAYMSRGFMGLKWDATGITFSVDLWKEVLRVAKPGATLLCFGGTRTWHRLACAIEDAGWVIKDTLMYLYGQGFPKSLNIAKTIAKKQGAKKQGAKKQGAGSKGNTFPLEKEYQDYELTEDAKIWAGYGTALKPAFEPIILAIKKPENSYAENALKWGVAGLNIDEARIGETTELHSCGKRTIYGGNSLYQSKTRNDKTEIKNYGRFPANVILECICDEVIEGGEIGKESGYNWEKSPQGNVPITNNIKSGIHYKDKIKIHTNPECPCYMLDRQSGNLGLSKKGSNVGTKKSMFGLVNKSDVMGYFDTGGASRFFYTAKASRSERNMGLGDLEPTVKYGCYGDGLGNVPKLKGERPTPARNFHPTVKPLALMEYLVKLTLMPNPDQIYLDPFAGSGSTLMAVKKWKRNFIGIEKDEEYIKIAEARIKATQENLL